MKPIQFRTEESLKYNSKINKNYSISKSKAMKKILIPIKASEELPPQNTEIDKSLPNRSAPVLTDKGMAVYWFDEKDWTIQLKKEKIDIWYKEVSEEEYLNQKLAEMMKFPIKKWNKNLNMDLGRDITYGRKVLEEMLYDFKSLLTQEDKQ